MCMHDLRGRLECFKSIKSGENKGHSEPVSHLGTQILLSSLLEIYVFQYHELNFKKGIANKKPNQMHIRNLEDKITSKICACIT